MGILSRIFPHQTNVTVTVSLTSSQKAGNAAIFAIREEEWQVYRYDPAD